MEHATLNGDQSARARTAIVRTELSRPVAQAMQDGVISGTRSVLDYGCGRGGDVTRLRKLGYPATGWDPAFTPDGVLSPADVVNLGYVVNVIQSSEERGETLRRAWDFARSALVVAARLDWQARGAGSRSWGDGIITVKGTFQKFYTQHELKSWIEATLGFPAHAAAPGVFYVFRDSRDAESFRARQVRKSAVPSRSPLSRLLYEQHRAQLEQLAYFLEEEAGCRKRQNLRKVSRC